MTCIYSVRTSLRHEAIPAYNIRLPPGPQAIAKFRSPPEFIPHAKFLYESNSADPCLCKYCSGTKSQRQVSQQFGLSSTTRLPGSTMLRPTPVVRRIVHAAKPAASPRQLFSRERNSDMRSKRPLRQAELVWAALDEPIRGKHPDEVIAFWPAIVMDAPRVKPHVIDHQPGKPYNIKQEYMYKLRLLGVMHAQVLPEHRILPFHAHLVPMELLYRLQEITPPPGLSPDFHQLHDFHPFPVTNPDGTTSSPPIFNEVALAFALGIQIAEEIRYYWTPTDPWEFKSSQPGMVERRFQGLWWGAERIWAGEVVRLKPSRFTLLDAGDAASSPDASRSRSPQLSQVKPASSEAAAHRGLFLQVSSIFAESVGDPANAECVLKVAGMLYETAELDWVEPSENGLAGSHRQSPFPSTSTQQPSLFPPQPSSSSSTSRLPSAFPLPQPTAASTSLTPSATADGGLSSPAPPLPTDDPYDPYSLPSPPEGFKWRPTLPHGYEVVLPITMIAGRYYPGMLMNPLVGLSGKDRHLPSASANGQEDGSGAGSVMHLYSLGGFIPGEHSAMGCVKFRPARNIHVKEGDEKARKALSDHWKLTPFAA